MTTRGGLSVQVPEGLQEDPSARFEAADTAGIRAYYDAQGYVIVRGVFDAAICDAARALWAREVKPSRAYFYRQGGTPELNDINAQGWVMNALLNLQSLDPRRAGGLREFATTKILTAPALRELFRALFDDQPKIVQSMYFEGNAVTREHQDTIYLDSERVGMMAAAWIALEDIEARAGRFFVCPGSHRLETGDAALEAIQREQLEIRAPRLEQGDVLFWNARTVHGSLVNGDPLHARSSITCHAIPARDRFLQLRVKASDVSTDEVNGVLVHRPKDQARTLNRLALWTAARLPGPVAWAKKAAVGGLARLRPRRTAA